MSDNEKVCYYSGLSTGITITTLIYGVALAIMGVL